jgi:signal transduction histidine kinase
MMMLVVSPYAPKTNDLATLSIVDENSIYDARDKMYRLFSLLDYDVFLTTYASTLFSDVCREIFDHGASAIDIGYHSEMAPHFLKFSFALKSSGGLERRMTCFFDEIKKNDTKSKKPLMEAYLKLDREPLSKKLVKDMRDVLNLKSKEDLYRELEKTYTQLSASKKMAQLEKMSAVGTLSAGIAHELNNPLMGIINFVQYCIKHTPEKNKCHDILQDAKREALRCAELIQNLLSFSRLEESDGETVVADEVDVVLVVDEVLKLLLYRIENEKIRIIRDAPGPVMAFVNRNHIKQVLLNIVTNALDAMQTVPKKILKINIAKEVDTLSIKIGDTGTGIFPAAMGRIFDPFFTTKPAGRGTGLGLSISENIIKKNQGEIKVVSEKGRGTTFDIRLSLTRGNDNA